MELRCVLEAKLMSLDDELEEGERQALQLDEWCLSQKQEPPGEAWGAGVKQRRKQASCG